MPTQKMFLGKAGQSVILGFCCVALLGPLHGQQGKNHPTYKFLRQNENWSVVAEGPSRTEDFFDPVKHVPLNESGSIWVSFGGHYRVRMESWDNFGFSDAEGRDDLFVNTRLLLHADIRVVDHVRFYVEGKTALATDRNLPGGRRPFDIDTADLLNVFVDLSVPVSDAGDFTFRVGRQELLFGKQRLVSPLPWGNSLRTFEGFSGELEVQNWGVTGFWVHPVKVNKYHFNRRDTNTRFYGVYASGRLPKTKAGWDIYWLGLDRNNSVFGGSSGRERRHTVGSRVGGRVRQTDFDYDAEAAYQFGAVGTADIGAYMVASEIGYTFFGAPASPRLHVGFDYATGDSGLDDEVGTFNQLFPLGHAYFGHIDSVARQNIVDLGGGLTVKPAAGLAVVLAGHNFWRANENDALYNAGGRVLRVGGRGSPKAVASEMDVLVKYKLEWHTLDGGGYGRFFTGEFLSANGPDRDVTFAYLWLQYTF